MAAATPNFDTRAPRRHAALLWANRLPTPLCRVLLLILCFSTGNVFSAELTEAEQFEAIFGETPSQLPKQTLYIPFKLNGRTRESLRVTITSGQSEPKIDATPLLEALEGKVRPEILNRLRNFALNSADETINIQNLNTSGLDATFDRQRLELQLKIPPEAKPDSIIHLSRRTPPVGAHPPVEQSSLSAFLNIRTGLDHVQQSASAEPGLQPLRADFDGAINWNEWVFEGAASFHESAFSPWRRGDLRIIHDDPAQRIRYTFGDLSYPVTGFQGFRPMAGLTVARNFSLQPYRVTEPRGQTSFFLKTSSTVEVLVNGRPVRTLHLEPGSHDLQDFLFSSGANDVVLRITDDVGRTETLRLSFFFDSRLLAAGEHEFSYSAGVPSHPGEWGPEYNTGEPVVSMFHRVGLTNTLTAGVNLQGDEDQQMLGIESVWATRWGTFQPDLAGSQSPGGSGYAARLGYRYYDASSPWGSAWNLSGQYRSPFFSTPGTPASPNPVSWNLSARYNQRLVWGLNGGIGGTYQIRRDGLDDLAGINLFLSKRVGRSGTVDLSLDRRDTLRGEVENRAFLSFTYLFPNHRHRIRTSHDSLTRTSRADWYYTPRTTIGGVSGNVGIQRRPDDLSLYGGARYIGYRGEASLFHDLATPSTEEGFSDSRTRFRFGTALVYADGVFAISRPVHDSFAIVAAHPHLEGHDIGVDPIHDTYSAKIDRWGPAVVPDLRSYLIQNVAVSAPELPPGYDLGPGIYTFQPTYKSGAVVQVGSDATVLLNGILQSADAVPISLRFGEILSLSKPEAPPIEVFTNRKGRFSVEGLRAGAYQLHLFGEPAGSVEFEIPPGSVGIYDIGTLQVEQR